MGKYVTVFLVVLLLNHDASMESGTCTYMCSILLHMQILYISHSICTTYAVQPRILYFNYFYIFLQPMNPLPSFFSVEKQQRCFRWPQNPPQKKVPTPAAAVCISRGVAKGSGGWVSPTCLAHSSIWGMPSQIGLVLLCVISGGGL